MTHPGEHGESSSKKKVDDIQKDLGQGSFTLVQYICASGKEKRLSARHFVGQILDSECASLFVKFMRLKQGHNTFILFPNHRRLGLGR